MLKLIHMKKILIIEDDTDMREALQSTFERVGYEVTATETSEEGLRIATNDTPDLIILDVMTHSLHASVFVQRIRKLPKGKNNSKIIVLTNLENDTTRTNVLESGADAFLIKVHTSLDLLVKKAKELIGNQE